MAKTSVSSGASKDHRRCPHPSRVCTFLSTEQALTKNLRTDQVCTKTVWEDLDWLPRQPAHAEAHILSGLDHLNSAQISPPWTRNLSHLIGNHGWQSCSNRQAVEPRCSFRDQRSSSVAARRWSVSLAQPHFQSRSHHKHRSDDSLRAVGRVTRGRFPFRCRCAENTAFLFGWCNAFSKQSASAVRCGGSGFSASACRCANRWCASVKAAISCGLSALRWAKRL